MNLRTEKYRILRDSGFSSMDSSKMAGWSQERINSKVNRKTAKKIDAVYKERTKQKEEEARVKWIKREKEKKRVKDEKIRNQKKRIEDEKNKRKKHWTDDIRREPPGTAMEMGYKSKFMLTMLLVSNFDELMYFNYGSDRDPKLWDEVEVRDAVFTYAQMKYEFMIGYLHYLKITVQN